MVSVVGRTTAAATTDRDGRYTLRDLPYGPYILSVHSRGYFKSRGRTIQLTAARVSVPEIQLARASGQKTPVVKAAPVPVVPVVPTTQLAGFSLDAEAPAAAAETVEIDDSDAGEIAWRLRHLPRSILKDASTESVWADPAEPEPVEWFGRGSSALAWRSSSC